MDLLKWPEYLLWQPNCFQFSSIFELLWYSFSGLIFWPNVYILWDASSNFSLGLWKISPFLLSLFSYFSILGSEMPPCYVKRIISVNVFVHDSDSNYHCRGISFFYPGCLCILKLWVFHNLSWHFHLWISKHYDANQRSRNIWLTN